MNVDGRAIADRFWELSIIMVLIKARAFADEFGSRRAERRKERVAQDDRSDL